MSTDQFAKSRLNFSQKGESSGQIHIRLYIKVLCLSVRERRRGKINTIYQRIKGALMNGLNISSKDLETHCERMTFLSFFCLNTLSSPPDSTGPMSTAHSHPPHLGGMVGHPSVISTSRHLPSPMATLGSPLNGLASPYPVITSSLGSPSMSLPSTPNMNFGQLGSPQVRERHACVGVSRWSPASYWTVITLLIPLWGNLPKL